MSLLDLAAEGDEAALSPATLRANDTAVKEIVIVVSSSGGVENRYFSHGGCGKPLDLVDYRADLNTIHYIAKVKQIGVHKAYSTFSRPTRR